MMYTKFLGSDENFYRLEIDYRQYKTVGKRKVIAWTAQTKNVFGDVPLTQYMLTGTPFDLRGYYMGQYRDKSSHVVAKPCRFRSLDRLRIHGAHSRQDRRCTSQLRCRTTY